MEEKCDLEKGQIVVNETNQAFKSPSSDGSSVNNCEPQPRKESSLENVELDHERGTPLWINKKWKRHGRLITHLLFALVLLGWWIPGIILPQTRHKWIVTTFWTWVFLLNMIFKWIPAKTLTNSISKIGKRFIFKPISRLNDGIKLFVGGLCVMGLIFGICFGLPLPTGGRYVDRLRSLAGLCLCQFSFWITSKERKMINWRTVLTGLMLQQLLALIILKTKAGFDVFNWVAKATTDFLDQGTKAGGFFFSEEVVKQNWFFVNTLSAAIFFVACVQLLYYLNLMQAFLLKFAWVVHNLFDISGAEAVVAAASPFVGQGESAMLVKPFVNHMTSSELHQTMASGFATIAGSVLAAYVQMGMPAVYMISASVMSIPASISLSKLRWPEEEKPLTAGKLEIPPQDLSKREANAMIAFSNGASLGLKVAGMIIANVLTVLGLLYTIDGLMTWIGQFWGLNPDGPYRLTLELILQYLLWPVSYLIGTPSADVLKVSRLLATKAISNEFVAYKELGALKPLLEERSFIIAVYSLCGFANFSSLAIQIGVLSSLAPGKKKEITSTAFSALICGYFSTIQTAAIAGMII